MPIKYDIIDLPVKEADFLCQNTPLVCEREHTVFLTGRRTRGFLLENIMPTGTPKSGFNKSWFRKGHKISKAMKKKLSISKMGSKNPMYGKIFTTEHRRKLSVNAKKNPPKYQFKKGHKPKFTEKTKQEHRKRLIKLNKSRIGIPLSEEHKENLKKNASRFWLGKRRPFYVMEAMRQSLLGKTGKLCHNWKGGYSLEPYPAGWTYSLKEKIRKRDKHKCRLCRAPQKEFVKKLPVHHVDYDKNNLDLINLITLCNSCNCKVNYKRLYWKLYFQKKQKVIYG